MNIALSGKLACGKSRLAEELKRDLNYTIISIGTVIKKTTSLLIEDTERFKMYLQDMLQHQKDTAKLADEVIANFEKNFSRKSFVLDANGDYVKNDSYRGLVQYIATSMRKKLGEDVWVMFIAKEAEKKSKQGILVVCDDLRFPSEKEIFENYRFNIVRLDVSKEVQKKRIQMRGDGEISEEQLNHPSETALDDANFDLRIDTDNLLPEQVKERVCDYLNLGAIK